MLKQEWRIFIPVLIAIFMASWASVWVHVASEDHDSDHAGHHHHTSFEHSSDLPLDADGHESHSLSDHEIDFDAVVIKTHKPLVHVYALLGIDLTPRSSIQDSNTLTDSIFHPPRLECAKHTSNRAPPFQNI